jgi:uncharacterized protein involved in outer membrane biogenesis
MNRRLLIWLAIPLGIILIIAAGILALPSLVASANHRATIEALASSVAGRKVHIAGSLSLNLFPEPRLVAGNVTIDGTNGETIKARSLTLDISMPSLLRGQLTASSLVLQSPVIAFPWPLPGGPSAVAPPPWLTTLHAQINNGRISFGDLSVSDISADIFTGAEGAVSISGTGKFSGQPFDLTLSLGAIDLSGQAPLAATFQTGQLAANVSGQFSTGNIVKGSLKISLHGRSLLSIDPGQDVDLSATLNANPLDVSLTALTINQGHGHLNGSAQFDIPGSKLTALLTGADISYPSLPAPGDLSGLEALNIHSELSIERLTLGGILLPQVSETSDISSQGITLTKSAINFPGATMVALVGHMDQTGMIQAQAHVTSQDLSQILPGQIRHPGGGPIAANASSGIAGSLAALNFSNINGTLSGGAFTGGVRVTTGQPMTINTNLHFKQLNLASAASLLQAASADHDIAGNFEVNADHASLGPLLTTRLLIDGGFSNNLTIRRISAALYDGMVLGSLTMQPDGTIVTAHALVSLPSAAPLAAFLPAGFAIPPAALNQPFSLAVTAAGATAALATNAAASLGEFSISASPVLNLDKYSLAGPLTLRHPSAIAAFKLFGANAGLAWPGPGSISLRTDLNLSGGVIDLPNFVISMGDLTAAGKITVSSDDEINGDINADTLALPPLPADLSAFWKILPSLHGKISLNTNQVFIAGTRYLGATNATIAMQPSKLAASIVQANIAGGNLAGNLAITQTMPQPPSLSGNFIIQHADLSQIQYPYAFPLALPAGIASMSVNLSSSGFTPQTWLATMSGTANVQASNGSISGFDLAGLAAAVTAPNRAAALKAAAQTGSSKFTSMTADCDINHGVLKFQGAKLQGPAGQATATGTIDLSDSDAALNLSLVPNLVPPATIGLAIIGGWSNPRKVLSLKSALAWRPQN